MSLQDALESMSQGNGLSAATIKSTGLVDLIETNWARDIKAHALLHVILSLVDTEAMVENHRLALKVALRIPVSDNLDAEFHATAAQWTPRHNLSTRLEVLGRALARLELRELGSNRSRRATVNATRPFWYGGRDRLIDGLTREVDSHRKHKTWEELKAASRSARETANLLDDLIHLSDLLRHALDSALESCRNQGLNGRDFYTFDFLNAILDMPGHRVLRCFEGLPPELPGIVRQELCAMAEPDRQWGEFENFEWTDDPYVRKAWSYARRSGLEEVSELHLFLAILNRPSRKTGGKLRGALGQHYETLQENVELELFGGRRQPPTP